MRLATLIATLLLATTAHAQSSCQTINNADARYSCEARATRQPGICGSINNDDKRHYCEAVAGRDPYRCNTINDDDTRNQCKAEAR